MVSGGRLANLRHGQGSKSKGKSRVGLKHVKGHFKKFAKNKVYSNTNTHPLGRRGSEPVAGGQSVTYNKCISLGVVENCDNTSRILYTTTRILDTTSRILDMNKEFWI